MWCTWRRSSRSWDNDMVAVRRIKWKSSMWTQLHGEYFCLSLFKLQFILGQSCSICNCQNLCFFLTHSDKPVKAWKSSVINGFWQHVISKIWIGSTGNKWSSSWIFSQDSLQWEFSMRFKRWWLNQSVNQTNVKERSSSWQCTIDIDWVKRWNKENCIANALSELLRTLEDSRKDIGHFWGLDARRNGREPIPIKTDGECDRTAWGMKLNFAETDILYFVPTAPWKEENWKAKEKKWKPFTSTVVMKPLNWFFAHLCPWISSVSTEQ